MDGMMLFSPSFFFYVLLLFVHHVEKSESLRLELIHPLSTKSPYFKTNITHSEMILRLNSQPRTRAQSPPSNSINNTVFRDMKVIRPILENDKRGFFAKVNLGMFHDERPSYKSYYLHFDTGSDITWLQCEDCAKPGNYCFRQNGDPYPNSMSSSYAPLLCGDHHLCLPNKCYGPWCSYNVAYNEGSHSFGILALETFNFDAIHTHQVETARIVIGCGIRNELKNGDDRLSEVGILGMSWGPHSFINQINLLGRFSYCLPPLFSDGYGEHSTILRFGFDTPSLHGLQSLPLHQYRRRRDHSYYVNLQDISINNKRLNIHPRYFIKTSPKRGGTVLDTGTSFTFITRWAYEVLKRSMVNYLASADTTLKLRPPRGNFDLCYWREQPFKGYSHLPTVTFHFEGGADLVLQRDIAFVLFSTNHMENVCLTIKPLNSDDNISIIGAQAQANHVFVYDLPHKMMYFGPRDCVRNP